MATPLPLLNATLDQLARHAPFDQMQREHLIWMVERLKLGYYAKDDVVLAPSEAQVQIFYIIKQGLIFGEQDVVKAQENQAWLELHEGECFPFGALLARRGVASTYRAGRDTFCYELGHEDFYALLHLSPAFHDFCSSRLANLLEQSKQIIQAQYTRAATNQQSMNSPLSNIIRREPVTCTPETPLSEVLGIMQRDGIGSMIAVDAAHRPVGIFTLHDVLPRVVMPGTALEVPFAQVMTPNPFTMPPHAFAYDAALAMAKYGFRHILVEENGRLKGLVSEKDLFSLQRVGLRQIGDTIRHATGLDTLRQSAQDIRRLAHNMMAQGVVAEQLTQIISTLNDLLTQRILDLELANGDLADLEFCWIALGSEGRFEQTLNTDQDNGIIFTVPEGVSADALRERLLPFAKRINDALAECGFPLCTGEVMASNPKWCLSLPEWKATFAHWIDHGDPKALLNASIFFDFRALHGAEFLAHELRNWLRLAAPKNSRFLHQMAANAMRNRPPLGFVREFVTGENHTLDLKLNGITPFVDAARIFNLAQGGSQTNTVGRIRELIELGFMQAQDAEAFIEAFLFIQLLRLRLHHEQCEAGQELSNKVDPDTLNHLDRRILREAYREARKLQTKLEVAYQL